MSIDQKHGEYPICGFVFRYPTTPHSSCNEKYCEARGSQICLTDNMIKYLRNRHTAYQEFKIEHPELKDTSDWNILEDALANPDNRLFKKILDFFASSRSYRLRYPMHRDLGIEYVNSVLKYHGNFSIFKNIWNSKSSLRDRVWQCRQIFDQMCDRSVHLNVGGIYRLYDLCGGKRSLSDITISQMHFLCLLFACELGAENEHFLRKTVDISEFVGKFQFFETFIEDAYFNMQKKFGMSKFALDANYLVSEDGFKMAKNLWNGYEEACTEFSTGSSGSLLDNPELQHVKKILLKMPVVDLSPKMSALANFRLASSFAIATRRQTPSVGFKSHVIAAYHAFKHQNEVDHYFGRKSQTFFDHAQTDYFQYARQRTRDYVSMVNEILASGKLTQIQPNQFDEGVTFKFESQQSMSNKKPRSYRVIVSCYSHAESYLLTCF